MKIKLLVCLTFTSCILQGCCEQTTYNDNQVSSEYQRGYEDGILDALDCTDEDANEDALNELDYQKIFEDYSVDYGYIKYEDMTYEDIGYDLIEAEEYDTLTKLREMYGDAMMLGDYVLDIKTNKVHSTSSGCSLSISSDCIKEIYIGKAISEEAEFCECIPTETIEVYKQ